MSRNPLASALYQQSALLSQRVAEKDPFFSEIALMGYEDRVRFAVLKTIRDEGILDMDLTGMSINEIIDEIALPVLQRMGQARFKADVLTNLGMKVGRPTDSMDHEL